MTKKYNPTQAQAMAYVILGSLLLNSGDVLWIRYSVSGLLIIVGLAMLISLFKKGKLHPWDQDIFL